MTPATKHPTNRDHFLTIAGVCLATIVLIGGLPSGVSAPVGLINVTPSEPIGLYVRTARPITRGTLVAFKPPEISHNVGDGRLARMHSFLKQVAAIGGDEVCSDAKMVLINQRPAGFIQKADARGRSLPHWSGCRTLSSEEVFVLSNRVANSFDSRYFGPVAFEQILGVYRPVWVTP